MGIGKTPGDIISFIQKEKIEVIDLRFMDFPGLWQHFTIPGPQARRGRLREGPGLRRLQHPRLAGDQRERHARRAGRPTPPSSIPSCKRRRSSMVCNICDPITGEDYTRDPRNIARKAEAISEEHRHRRHAYFGPEAEFFIFDDIRYDQNEHEGYYHIDRVGGPVEHGPRGEPATWATRSATRKATSPFRPSDQLTGHPQRDDADARVHRHAHRGPAPRGGHRRAVPRSTCGSTTS